MAFATDSIDATVVVVPPPSSWSVDPAMESGLTHLNLEISTVWIQDYSQLYGILVATRAQVLSDAGTCGMQMFR